MLNSYRKSNIRLLLTMIAVSLLVTAMAITLLFGYTLKSKKNYLKDLSRYQQMSFTDLSLTDSQHLQHPGLGETGEWLITMRNLDSVWFFYVSSSGKDTDSLLLPVNSALGKPGIHAALGDSGFVRGPDYRGHDVLAYTVYLQEERVGLVTKINVSEVIRPFIKASILAGLASLVILVIGIVVFRRFSRPLTIRIRESEEKYRTFFELIPSGITIADAAGQILESNRESERILGISISESNARQIDSKKWKIVRPDLTPMPPAEFASTIALSENRVVTNVEMGIVKEKGRITWLHVSAAPVPIEGLGVIVVYTDITRRIEAENRLREHELQLEDNSRVLKELNDTKDKFFGIIAHDLKNPFSSLLGATEYLYRDVDLQDRGKIRKLAKILYESAQSGFDILTNLLEWSRSQTGTLDFQPENINLGNLVKKNIHLLSVLANAKNIRIETEIDPLLKVWADDNMLNSVLRNLLTNALKFSHPGGIVRISAEETGNSVCVSVSDQGTGIPEEDISKLFRIDTKYVNQGTSNEGGTGLGLILCKEFIQRHGGDIGVQSSPDKGSLFYFTLPGS